MNIKRIALPAAAIAGALALAACGGGHKDEQPASTGNVENMTPIEAENATPVATEAPAAPRIDNANTESAPVRDTLSADERTQDDADATGMTARVSRDEGGNEAQPAQ